MSTTIFSATFFTEFIIEEILFSIQENLYIISKSKLSFLLETYSYKV